MLNRSKREIEPFLIEFLIILFYFESKIDLLETLKKEMIIKLQGLVNILSKSSFEININDDENVSLSDFHFTFDSIYLIKSNEPFIFDFKTNSFLPLFENSTFKLISFSSNTSYLWIFGVENSQNFSLFQYSNRQQLNKYEIHLERDFLPRCCLDADLVIQSTDVNVYLFENNQTGLKCLYQLRKHADLDENQAAKEVRRSHLNYIYIFDIII